MRSNEIIRALRQLYGPPEWITAEEFQYEPGYDKKQRRLDFLAFNAWPSKSHVIHGMEIKISRSDFLSEIKNPQKRERAVELCDEFYFVAPIGIIKPAEIPKECGYISVDPLTGNLANIMKPQIEKEFPALLPRTFLAGISRNWNDRYDAHDIRMEIRNAKRDLIYELQKNR